jgi:hypothetical protein
VKSDVWDLPETYHDESGERFRELFVNAERVRSRKQKAVRQFLFWTAVIFVLGAVVMAKLYAMGAIVGVK